MALGASGISELSDAYIQSVRTPEEWRERVMAGRFASMRGWHLTQDDLRRKWLIQHLMCQGEVSKSAYAEKFDEALSARLPDLGERLAPFVDDGLLSQENGTYHVTSLGRLFLRVIAMSFDAYLPKTSPEQPVFSRTV